MNYLITILSLSALFGAGFALTCKNNLIGENRLIGSLDLSFECPTVVDSEDAIFCCGGEGTVRHCCSEFWKSDFGMTTTTISAIAAGLVGALILACCICCICCPCCLIYKRRHRGVVYRTTTTPVTVSVHQPTYPTQSAYPAQQMQSFPPTQPQPQYAGDVPPPYPLVEQSKQTSYNPYFKQ